MKLYKKKNAEDVLFPNRIWLLADLILGVVALGIVCILASSESGEQTPFMGFYIVLTMCGTSAITRFSVYARIRLRKSEVQFKR